MGTICLPFNTINEQMLRKNINKINEIIYRGILILKEGQSFPLKATFEADGTISRLVQLLQHTELTNCKIKHKTALAIGTVFKATLLPKEIRSLVINIIKQNLDDEDDSEYKSDLIALKHIAECKSVL
ncbi:MAG: hypothetical protein EZS28_023934 [Streblomastix strix]|uniref:Uncharacterized protein n=1 Tax=Streblomastix strix TaxID=222440 RepID=A0A5J4VDC2_9EUKA|nr:MAG: hypothetical protein EZS28_023934 [Streblomastix strix]